MLPSPLPDGWREMLQECDLTLARTLIIDSLDRESAAAKQRGEELWLDPSFLGALKQFAADTSPATATALIEVFPALWDGYFAGCLPGGHWADYRDMGRP